MNTYESRARGLCVFVLLLTSSCANRPHQELRTADSLRQEARALRAAAIQPPPQSGSLWTERSGPVWRDFKARAVGDVVIVNIVEETQATSKSNTKLAKSSETPIELPALLGLDGRLKVLADLMTGTGDRSHTGDGATARNLELNTMVGTRVAEVLPNGDLIIQGSRTLVVNDESQRVVLVGVVRPSDIDAAGRVSSTNIADLEVILDGKGLITDTERPNWLYRLLAFGIPQDIKLPTRGGP